MRKTLTLSISPEQAADTHKIQAALLKKLAVRAADFTGYQILRRSIDARAHPVRVQIQAEVFIGEDSPSTDLPGFQYRDVHQAAQQVIIIGAGPAGLFAALNLLELGIRPVILERGKDVRTRRRDLARLNKEGLVNPDSNYCFGEGGAGTYSDGKLYTRSHKRGDVKKILQVLVHFGADPSILFDNHPHIGTNKLPGIIVAMREHILACGGQIHFEQRVTDLQIRDGLFKSCETHTGQRFDGNACILATGHSARDIFELLHAKGLQIEAKPFALGVRVEHPQELIDQIQYHCPQRGPYLPPASYSLVRQVQGRGVFSFCMCPGGIIAPAATAPGEIVVNGWSPSKRNNPFANSGMVVAVDDALLAENGRLDPNNPFRFLHFQQAVEQKAFTAGGGGCVAPAQRLIDFCEGKLSNKLPPNSYIPGLQSSELHRVLPKTIFQSLAAGFKGFGKMMKGYYTQDALVVATESRTSSPVRIPRDPEKGNHPQVLNLYPCGEGAGYAGGIVSAAMDGEKMVLACTQNLLRS